MFYNGRTTDSNTVVGELLEVLSVGKNAITNGYFEGDSITDVISLVNSGTAALTDLTVTDDLGGYSFGANKVYPLEYVADLARKYVNGTLRQSPAVTAGPPLAIPQISVPAGGNALVIYETTLTGFAPLDVGASVTNTATVTGGGITNPITSEETVEAKAIANLSISKMLSPVQVTENGMLTYTFVIENSGNTAATELDGAVISDTFSPILNSPTVTFNSTVWNEGTQYTYNAQTGEFVTVAGAITVLAAEYTRSTDGTWTVKPGSSTLIISGTV